MYNEALRMQLSLYKTQIGPYFDEKKMKSLLSSSEEKVMKVERTIQQSSNPTELMLLPLSTLDKITPTKSLHKTPADLSKKASQVCPFSGTNFDNISTHKRVVFTENNPVIGRTDRYKLKRRRKLAYPKRQITTESFSTALDLARNSHLILTPQTAQPQPISPPAIPRDEPKPIDIMPILTFVNFWDYFCRSFIFFSWAIYKY